MSPHAEFGGDVFSRSRWFRVQPFGMCDWANNWQKASLEKGSAGMSLTVPSQYASLLRSEAGIRLYETLAMRWGQLVFVEKGSYVNQTPFYSSSPSTLFIGSAAIFSLTTGSLSIQNLGAIEFRCSFLPSHPRIPYFTIDLQAELGSSMQSYFVSMQVGKNF